MKYALGLSLIHISVPYSNGLTCWPFARRFPPCSASSVRCRGRCVSETGFPLIAGLPGSIFPDLRSADGVRVSGSSMPGMRAVGHVHTESETIPGPFPFRDSHCLLYTSLPWWWMSLVIPSAWCSWTMCWNRSWGTTFRMSLTRRKCGNRCV